MIGWNIFTEGSVRLQHVQRGEGTCTPAVWRETNAGVGPAAHPSAGIHLLYHHFVNELFKQFKTKMLFIIYVSSFEPLVPWTFWLCSSFFCLFLHQLPCLENELRKKKREFKQKALKPWRRGSSCQNVGQLWACRTQSIHSRETMKYCFLTIQTFQLMYCIFYKMLVIYL